MKTNDFASLIFIACFAATSLSADPKPAGSKPWDAQSIANYYAGKSEVWKNCKGGVYYDGGWVAQAYCNKDGESVGVGTWNVKNGKVCHQLTWNWPQGDGVGTKDDKAYCRNLVVAPDGVVWLNWGEDNEWWRLENQDSIVKGFESKRNVNKWRKKLGV
jgi:hypothetical protein